MENIDTKAKVKQRSPNFPNTNLETAIEKVRLLYSADKLSGSTRDSAYIILGYSGQNGKSLQVIGALKQYGLIENDEGSIFVTENARLLLVLSPEDEAREEILRKCALSPELFGELWGKYKETGLPSDATLKSYLLREYGFNESSVDRFIKNFRGTLEFAGIGIVKYKSDPHPKAENTTDNVANYQTLYKSKMNNLTVEEYKIPRTKNQFGVIAIELPITKKDIEAIRKLAEMIELFAIEEETEVKNETVEQLDEN